MGTLDRDGAVRFEGELSDQVTLEGADFLQPSQWVLGGAL